MYRILKVRHLQRTITLRRFVVHSHKALSRNGLVEPAEALISSALSLADAVPFVVQVGPVPLLKAQALKTVASGNPTKSCRAYLFNVIVRN